MKIVFVSNYFNHHQAPITYEFDKQTNHNFYFIETIPMEQERKKLGWGNESKPDYVLQSYLDADSMESAQQLILNADVVIWGSCPFEMISPRLKMKKLTFAYSERIFKSGNFISKLLRAVKYNFKLRRYQDSHYLLCASGYAAEDYNKIGLFKDKSFKWGYFPETKIYENIDELISSKEKKSILWVARFIDWKHPEIAVNLAKYLKTKGYEFTLNMIGTGPLENDIKANIENNNLSDCVHALGSMSPEKVREHMEKSEIFIFTSDRNEGWGAVLNEAMNSACATVSNKDIGAVPYLVDNSNNGFKYNGNDFEELYSIVESLLNNHDKRCSVGRKAYSYISDRWNAKTAVSNFLLIVNRITIGNVEGKKIFLYDPCTNA